jgi:hypothetical protein
MKLVALGHSQVPRVDLSINYVLIVNNITIKLMLMFKKAFGWSGETVDVEI